MKRSVQQMPCPGQNCPRRRRTRAGRLRTSWDGYPNMRKDACKWFDRWFKMVNGYVLKE